MTEGRAATTGVLEGVRVLNLSSTFGGALIGQFFADHGADVCIVEPQGGSPLRSQAGWPAWARGSSSVEATLDDPRVQAMAATTDLLIDTFRPGVTERHGLGYELLAEKNPRLVYTSLTGFGRTGPLASVHGYEGVVMAKIGAYSQLSALVERTGPAFSTVPLCTVSASFLAITGSLVALFERERSGVGQRVDATLLQGVGAHDVYNWMIAFWSRKYPDAFTHVPAVNTTRRVPNSWFAFSLMQALTADGRWLQFSQTTTKQFRAFMVAAGVDEPDWERAWQDEDLDRRIEFWDRMINAVRSRTLAEWNELFDLHPDVFAEVFRSGTELLSHPQLVFDDQIAVVTHPDLGPVTQLKPMVRLAQAPGSAIGPLPALDSRSVPSDGAGRSHPDADPPPRGALPLEGVTIIELGSFFAALFGATTLADLGARVLKIEQLDGDPIRYQLPSLPEIGAIKVLQGKESVAVDIKTPEGLEIVHRLVASADIVLESFRGGVAERLGLDEESLRAVNPDIVFHEAPGFGTGGPYGRRPAYAPTISAGSGLSRRNVGPSVPEHPDLSLDEVKTNMLRLSAGSGTPGHPDGYASLAVACGMALGLYARERGRGPQSIVTTMLSTMGYVLSEDIIEYAGRPAAPTPDADLFGFGPLYRLYESQEGWVFLAAPSDAEWVRLRDALADSAPLADVRFATAELREKHAVELTECLAAAFRQRPAAAWEPALAAVDLACVVVAEEPSHEVLLGPGGLAYELGMTTEVEHPIFGEHTRLSALISFSRSATRAEAGMTIGQHTDSVLREYGYSEEELTDLAARGVIGH